MSEKAPMPPWWVEEEGHDAESQCFVIYGGKRNNRIEICTVWGGPSGWSNAREIADLICQRTKP